jgi:hypothetical protein
MHEICDCSPLLFRLILNYRIEFIINSLNSNIMKTFIRGIRDIILCFPLLIGLRLAAQSIASKTIEVGNFNALVNADGVLFYDGSNLNIFNVPKEGTVSSLFAANLWIGGLDLGSELHIAAQTYKQSGSDFWPGPLDTITASIDSATMSAYNKVFDISKLAVDSFKAGLGISQEILDWPGNGDVSKGISQQMAPYIDVDQDGHYDPYNGDYPDVRGDKMLWFVYNDAYDVHGETSGDKLGVEIRASIYGYDCAIDTDAYNSFFVHYDIYNRSSYSYNNVYLGTWADIDLGFYLDDYIGSMVDQHSFYGYNGDADDDSPLGYGTDLVAQSVTILKGPYADMNDGRDNDLDGFVDEPDEVIGLSGFMYYNNDFSNTGNPDSSLHFYNYMKSVWKDGEHLTYGGNGYGDTLNCDYMFPGNSDTAGFGTGGVPQPEWSEMSVGNTPSDRRGVAGIGPLTFDPEQKITLDMAYVFAQNLSDPNDSLSLDLLKNRIQNIRNRFEIGDLKACSGLSEIVEANETFIEVFPNPAKDVINVLLPDAASYNIKIRDVLGRELINVQIQNQIEHALDIRKIPSGYYFLSVEGTEIFSEKVLVE